jgi:hypothetical protein
MESESPKGRAPFEDRDEVKSPFTIFIKNKHIKNMGKKRVKAVAEKAVEKEAEKK